MTIFAKTQTKNTNIWWTNENLNKIKLKKSSLKTIIFFFDQSNRYE